MSRLRRLLTVPVRTERELRIYVARTTCLCAIVALGIDVANQLIFFEGWVAAIRSWMITAGVVVIIAVPVSRAIGKAHLALFHASRTDPLTGLLNRRALLEGLDEQPAIIALVMVDIDRFKQVNDKHGHMIGDAVLRSVALVLASGLKQLGRIGRLGGEEFAVLAVHGTPSDLVTQLESLRERLALTPIVADATAVSVTISAGVALRAPNQTFEQLYARADRALYVAKASGRNRIVLAEDIETQLGPGLPVESVRCRSSA